MDSGTIFFGLCVLAVVVGLVLYLWVPTVEPLAPIIAENGGAGAAERLDAEMARIAPVPLGFGGPVWQPPVPQSSDPRFSPLPPEQSYYAPPGGLINQPIPAGVGAIIPLRGTPQLMAPINVMTQGYPDAYQQIGALTAPGGTDMSASPNRTVLPLFGRRTNTGQDRWNYYTRTDGMNPIQVPLQFKRQNCDDDNGCQEIITGDSVGVPILGQSYTANVFRYATPRYIPVV